MLGFIHFTSAKGKLPQIIASSEAFSSAILHKPLAMTLRSAEHNTLITNKLPTSYTLALGGYSDASDEIEGFYDATFCFCPLSLDMEHSFRCPFLLHRGPGFFDCVLRGQNGILSCLLCYNLLGLMFRAPHVYL